MFSIISFGNVRINGMKSPVMPYAALGVGLAIVLTVGLSAIAGVVEQPLMEGQQLTMEQETMKAPSPEMVERQADVGPEAESVAGSGAPVSEEKFGIMKEQEQYYMTAEPPASPFTGLLMVMPYIAAAIVGSVVFVVVRKRAGF